MNYNFSTLNDKEFEELSRDLLNATYNLDLQSFKKGKDGGIDLRYSSPKNSNAIVVQVKHYIKSGYSPLKKILKDSELVKLKVLLPGRYIVVTSIELSASQKNELKNLLHPFVLSSNDIFGQEDLNKMLANKPEIEKNYFKLWFSSVQILTSIINNAIEGRSKFLLENIKYKIPYYVLTKNFVEASKILANEKVLLITGQPGIGKTTLAEILLFDCAKNGTKIFQLESINDAEDVFSSNPDEKQLFYFDDFLGANYAELINTYRLSSHFTSLVERIRHTPNKYLLLTTRTIILNQVVSQSEKINNLGLVSKQFELKLSDYNRIDKAKILYNHLYFNGIDGILYEEILTNKFYNDIINHRNYTPRIIEFITAKSRTSDFTGEAYHQFILNNLNNPKEIWRYSFTQQIKPLDQGLLFTLFTFENGCQHHKLNLAYESRLSFEKTEHNQIIFPSQFSDSIKTLLNGFITATRQLNKTEVNYTFLNPSLVDFLIEYIKDSYSEKKAIIAGIKYSEQLKRFSRQNDIFNIEIEIQEIIQLKIASNELVLEKRDGSKYKADTENAKKIVLLQDYCFSLNNDILLKRYFKLLATALNWYDFREEIVKSILNLGDNPLTYAYLNINFAHFVTNIVKSTIDVDEAKQIPLLFNKFNKDISEFTNSGSGFSIFIDMIGRVLKGTEDLLIFEQGDSIFSDKEVLSLYDDIYSLESDLKNVLFPKTYFAYDFDINIDDSFWERKIKENRMEEGRIEFLRDYNNDEYVMYTNFDPNLEDNIIDDLFSQS